MEPLIYNDECRTQKTESFGFTSAKEIYGAIYPNVASFDVSASLLKIPNGSTIENVTAVAGYFKNDNAQAPSNAVGLFGCGMVTANNGAGWGINTLLQDSAVREAGTGTGRILIGAELDFNVMNPGTQVIGVSVGGNSLAQPANASAYVCNTLSQSSGYRWTTGFASFDGAATYAFSAGMSSVSGANVDSQPVIFQYTNSAGAKQNAQISIVGGGYLQFTGSIPLKGYSFKFADVLIDSGKHLIVNGYPVVSDRRTGWTLPTGNKSRASFDPATVTVEELAKRLAALIEDLYSGHGLIGA